MSEKNEETLTETTPADALIDILKELSEQTDTVIRVENRWYMERLMPVSPENELLDGPVDEADLTRWMATTLPNPKRKETERIVEFNRAKNPEDKVRTVREYVIHVVEDEDQ